MIDDNTQKALKSLAMRKVNSTIAIAADLANDHLNSICRIALAWICNGSVHGISYLVKPPEDQFTSRKITADMVQDSQSFATVWDEEISMLLKDGVLSAYRSEYLFLSIKASYEAGGRPFVFTDVYIRDLRFLTSTYIPDLGNDSFVSIMHYMKIPVDLDNALSRAMACVCGIDWLEKLYPVTGYGIPLSAIMAGALQPPISESPKPQHEGQHKYERLSYYTRIFFIPFLILCLFVTSYYLYRYEQLKKTDIDFSAYSATKLPQPEPAAAPAPLTRDRHYIMMRGAYVIPEEGAIAPFIEAMKSRDIEKIRAMIRADKVVVLVNPTRVQILGEPEKNGFIPIKILEGDYTDMTGFASTTMINK